MSHSTSGIVVDAAEECVICSETTFCNHPQTPSPGPYTSCNVHAVFVFRCWQCTAKMHFPCHVAWRNSLSPERANQTCPVCEQPPWIYAVCLLLVERVLCNKLQKLYERTLCHGYLNDAHFSRASSITYWVSRVCDIEDFGYCKVCTETNVIMNRGMNELQCMKSVV